MIEAHVRLRRDGFQLDASLAVDGPATALLGPSGAGKTTLLLAIAGLVEPDEGTILVDGEALYDSSSRIHCPPERRGIGVVFQDGLLFPHLTAEGNLRFGCRNGPVSFDQVVDLLDLGGTLHRRPADLSGGERRRVALGRALLSNPRLLLLDEPLTGLDAGLKGRVLPYLIAVRDELGIPILYVSHAIREALFISRDIAVMAAGRILCRGAFHEVLRDPRVFEVARSLGIENVIPAVVVEKDPDAGYDLVRVGDRTLKAPPLREATGTEVSLSVRADEVVLASGEPKGLSARNVLPGVVAGLEPVAGRVLVRVDAGFPLVVEVTPDAAGELKLREGRPVWCVLKTHSLRSGL